MMPDKQVNFAQLNHTANLWKYEIEDDKLLAQSMRPSHERDLWQKADREKPLYLRLADLAEMDDDKLTVLTSDWREQALAFANLFAPPVADRQLAVAREIPLDYFAQEALLMRWVLYLRACLRPRKKSLRIEAAKVMLQILAIMPDLPMESLIIHQPKSAGEKASDFSAPLITASLDKAEIQRRLKALYKKHGQQMLWQMATNVLAGLMNVRLAGVNPICLPYSTPSGMSQLSFGFNFPSPLARIWYGLLEDSIGMKISYCEKCDRTFIARRANQRYCSKKCQLAAGAQRHRDKQLEAEMTESDYDII